MATRSSQGQCCSSPVKQQSEQQPRGQCGGPGTRLRAAGLSARDRAAFLSPASICAGPGEVSGSLVLLGQAHFPSWGENSGISTSSLVPAC